MKPRQIIISAVSIFISGLAIPAMPALAQQTVQPAPIPQQAAIAQPTNVLVLPLEMYGDAAGFHWIGQAVQQNLNATATGNAALHALTLTNAPATIDVEAVTKAAKEAGAAIVAFGSYRVVDNNISIVAYLMDVPTGRLFSAIKTEGPIRSLFTMEDQLDTQFIQAIGQQIPAVAAVTAAKARSLASAEALAAPAPVATNAPSADTAAPQAAAAPNNTLPPMTYPSTESTPYYQSYSATPQYTAPTYYNPYDYSTPYDSTYYPSYYVYPSFGLGFGYYGGYYHHHDYDHGWSHSNWGGASPGFHTGSSGFSGSHFSGGMSHGGGHR